MQDKFSKNRISRQTRSDESFASKVVHISTVKASYNAPDAETAPLGARQAPKTSSEHTQKNRLDIELLPFLAAVLDGVWLVFAVQGGFWLSAGQTGVPTWFAWEVSAISALLFIGQSIITKQYSATRVLTPFRSIKGQSIALGITALIIWAVYFAKPGMPYGVTLWRDILGVIALMALFASKGIQFFMVNSLARAGRIERRIVVIGAGPQTDKLVRQVTMQQPAINHVVGVFDDRIDRLKTENAAQAILGKVADVIDYVRTAPVDEVLIALPWSACDRISHIVDQLRDLPVKVRIASDMIGYRFPGGHLDDDMVRGLWMMQVMDHPMSGWKNVVKLIEDRILAGIAILFLSPVMFAVAVAIRIESPGPVLFRQKRFGFNNQVFYVLKFRSMYHRLDPKAGSQQATRDDPRITRVGRFIRRTSLDELPQLFNVLGGSMSMVGPRPHSVDHNKEYAKVIGGYFGRHKVRPGITGWAQINGLRGETDTLEKMEYRVRYDIYYIENWSVLLDLEILMLTVFYGTVGKNAY